MGTDINGVLQKRGPKEGEWTTFAPIEKFFDGRSYMFFGILANVRQSEYEPIAYRGLPKDFLVNEDDNHAHIELKVPYSAKLQTSTWMGYHNFGHCTFKEFLDYNWTQTYLDYDESVTTLKGVYIGVHHDVYKICVEEKTQPEDIRVVFGFDS